MEVQLTRLQELLGIDLPIIQAPMAGVQGSELAVAVSNAGGLGSLPCAMLSPEAIGKELSAIRAGTSQPFNVNFFCHTPPEPSPEREALWRETLSRYYGEFGIDVGTIQAGPGRAPFSLEVADVVEAFKPPVVSFHFGLPSPELARAGAGVGLQDSLVSHDDRRSPVARVARRGRDRCAGA